MGINYSRIDITRWLIISSSVSPIEYSMGYIGLMGAHLANVERIACQDEA